MFLSVFIHLWLFSWTTSSVEGSGLWPWTKTKYLTRSNWSSLLIPHTESSDDQHSVWFIFHYLNYCGYCKKAEPGWEAVAQYAANWTKYIQVGAYDCASESVSTKDICQDERYPKWRIYCPLTNSTQLAFNSERHTDRTKAEEIFLGILEKVNDIAEQCYGKSWPVKKMIAPTSKDDLNRIIPKNVNRFQLFSDDNVLNYTLYVFNHSKTVQLEPIYHLASRNQLTEGPGIWTGIRQDNGDISLQSSDVIKPLKLYEKHTSRLENVEEINTSTIKPTVSDVDSAVVWMITRDLRRRLPALFDNVKTWINVLYTYYPGSDTMKNFLYDFNEFLKTRTTLSANELQNYTNSTSIVKLPAIKFDHCNGSDPSKRGYPCTLWVLFHSLTVQQAILAEVNQLSSDVKPSDLIVAIREFIRNFFLCAECVTHFVNMTSDAENEIHTYNQTVLYLWQNHNSVNERLRYENTSTDPNWPKVPFPTKTQCNSCVTQTDENGDAIQFDDNQVYQYLKEFYSYRNSALDRQTNEILLFMIFVIYRLL